MHVNECNRRAADDCGCYERHPQHTPSRHGLRRWAVGLAETAVGSVAFAPAAEMGSGPRGDGITVA